MERQFSVLWFANLGFLLLSILTVTKTHQKRREISKIKLEIDQKEPETTSKSCQNIQNFVDPHVHDWMTSSQIINPTVKPPESPNIVEKVKNLPPIVTDYLKITDWQAEWKNRITRHRKVCQAFPEKTSILQDWLNKGPVKSHNSYSMIDTNHKVIYCELPKCGCTNWKMTMKTMIHMPDDKNLTNPSWTYGKDNGRKRRSLLDIDIDAEIEKAIEKGIDIDKLPNLRYAAENGRFGRYVLEEAYSIRDRVQAYTNGTYFRFIFVRHPLERLLSGYRDKVQRYFLNRPIFTGLKEEMYRAGKEREFKEIDVHGFHAFLRYLVLRGISHTGGGTVSKKILKFIFRYP